MDFQPIERPAHAFQQPVTAAQLQAVCHRVFGPGGRVSSATELGLGMYNTTFRVAVEGQERPVIIRFAPEPGRQLRSEREFMRNEYATVPHLAVIAPLMPRVIAADWSHDLVGRDYLVQTLLDGVPAAEGLRAHPRPSWTGFYRRIGEIAKTVHAVRGPAFGTVSQAAHATWSQAVIESLHDIAADLDAANLEAADIRKTAELAAEHHAVLDEITEPRLLTGDLWTVNIMIAANAPEPVITGVFDLDRTSWGDPAADWPIRMASAKQDERLAFWESYGEPERGPAAVWRSRVYEMRHLGAVRLEHHRHDDAGAVGRSYEAGAAVLAALT
ncbi:phosphotransferase family protein [Nonomuraea zeae]|uniref:Aminoglycoside phosphotransferase family protein n=1 Tax=Nonomuraea zeae TaxID=1642303 RepID=A0A5S4FP02_9ACTN|nr:aminoglycoside phosphotransferase family protein [Nonomuraea zeae]TMR22433.1 aminoglycoside phosphotransferase family protein [Nonomuraea zeae]